MYLFMHSEKKCALHLFQVNFVYKNDVHFSLNDKDIQDITKTRLYNFDPLKPHFYIVKLGLRGVHIIFFFSAQKHRLWVHVRTSSAEI